MPTLPIICNGREQPDVDFVYVPSIARRTENHRSGDHSEWLRDPLSHRFPNARILSFEHDFARSGDTEDWSTIPSSAEELLYGLKRRRGQASEERRPLIFICHGLGSLVLKSALCNANCNSTFLDIFESTIGVFFLACIHDERRIGLERHKNHTLWCTIVELGVTKTKKDPLVESLRVSKNWSIVKQVLERFRELAIAIPFPIRTFYETKPTVYQLARFGNDKEEVLCPELSAFLGIPLEKVEPTKQNHTQLSRFPARIDPFCEVFIKELGDLLESRGWKQPHSSNNVTAESESLICALGSSITQLRLESSITSGSFPAITSQQQSPSTKELDLTFPCHLLGAIQTNPRFTGRDDLLETLEIQLCSNDVRDTNSEAQVYVLSGLGGIGKTQVALKFATDHSSYFRAILWVQADSRNKISDRFSQFAYQLGLMDDMMANPSESLEVLRRWFADTSIPWLVVFDNADTEDCQSILADVWPSGNAGSILITSRNRSLTREFPGENLSGLFLDDAINLLLRLTYKDSESIKPNLSLSERMSAEILAKRVDCFPLALDQIAKIAINDCCSLQDISKAYDDCENFIEDCETINTVSSRYTQYPHSLATVWNMSYDRLESNSRTLLNAVSFLDPDNIQFWLLTKAVDSTDFKSPFRSKRDLTKARGALLRSSLIYQNLEEDVIMVHRLVQASCHVRMLRAEHEELQQCFDLAFKLIENIFPNPPAHAHHDRSLWAMQQALLPHVQALAHSAEYLGTKAPLCFNATSFAKLLEGAAYYLYERGVFEPAFELLDRAEKICVRSQQRSSVLLTLADLSRVRASIATETNQPQQAYTSFLQELHLIQEAITADVLSRPEIREVFALGGIANGLQGLQRFPDAEEYYRRSLDAFRGIPGKLFTMSVIEPNLATCLWLQGKNKEARAVLDSIITEKNDTSSYRTAHAMYTLGNVQISDGLYLLEVGEIENSENKLEEAFQTHKKVLELFKVVLGHQHHKTGDALHKVAWHLHRRRQYRDSALHLEEALRVYEHSHLFRNEIARSTFKLGCVIQDSGDVHNGRLLIGKAEELRKDIIGADEWVPAIDEREFDRLVMFWSR